MNKTNVIKISTKKVIFIFFALCIFSNTVFSQKLSLKEKYKTYLGQHGKDGIKKIKKSLANTLKNFTGNDLYLLGSLDVSKQIINDNGISNPFNYLYNSVNNNSFKSGYSVGCRIDGLYKLKQPYSFVFALNRISTGNKYINQYNAEPFLEDFTHLKVDNQFTTFSAALHYRKLLPFNDINKFKFYVVAGPSLDYKISNISNDNLVDGSGKRALINADFGTEFDNNGYYIFFVHYKYGTNLNKSTAQVQLSRFEIGMTIKRKDLF